MEQREVSAKLPAKEGRNAQELSAVVAVNFPETVEEAIDWCGAEALLSNAFANWRVTLQANIRSGLEKGETEASLQTRLANAIMGVAQGGGKIDPQAAFIAKFRNATPEEQQEMLAKLQEAAQG